MRTRICSILLTLALSAGLCLPASAAGRLPTAPSGLLLLEDGTLLFTDLYQRALWQQTPGQSPVTLAGGAGLPDINGQPLGGYTDGPCAQASFAAPWAVAPYRDGWAVTDSENHAVRYVTAQQVYTLAGTDTAGAPLSLPTGLAAGPDGCLYVADTGTSLIYQITADGAATVWAGAGEGRADGPLKQARFLEPTGLFFSDGVLYVCDSGNNRICKIENGMVTTLAGASDGAEGHRNGAALAARFAYPQGITAQGGDLYIADTGNGAIRLIRDGMVSTLCTSGSLAGGLYPVSPRGLAVSGSTLWVGDVFARSLFSLALTPAPTPLVYTDVIPGAPQAAAVDTLSRRGLMLGVGDDRFSPDGPLTRAMLVTVLSRLHAATFPSALRTGESAFSDVSPDAWYASAAWAADQGLVSTDQSFRPDQALTQAELLVLLYRFSDLAGGDLSADHESDAPVPAWAAPAYAWALSQGLITTDQAADHDRPVTRADGALLMAHYLSLAQL